MGQIVRAILTRADRIQHERSWLAVPVAVVKKFGDDRAGSLAALVAYFGFFSIFPLLLVLVTLGRMFLDGEPELQRQLIDSALSRFPVIGADIRRNLGVISGNPWALAIGVIGSIWAGLGVIDAVAQAMDGVWGVPWNRGMSFITRKLRGLLMLGTLGAALLAGSVIGIAGSWVFDGLAATVSVFIITLAVNGVVFTAAYTVLTAARISWRQTWRGAFAAAAVWTALQAFGASLIQNRVQGASDLYGFFAIVLGLLWWIYLGAQIALFGAEYNAVREKHLWPRWFFGEQEDPKTDSSSGGPERPAAAA